MKCMITFILLVSVVFSTVSYANAQDVHEFAQPLYFPTNCNTVMYDSDGRAIVRIPRGTVLMVVANFTGTDGLGCVIAGLKAKYNNYSGIVRLAHIDID